MLKGNVQPSVLEVLTQPFALSITLDVENSFLYSKKSQL